LPTYFCGQFLFGNASTIFIIKSAVPMVLKHYEFITADNNIAPAACLTYSLLCLVKVLFPRTGLV